MSNRFAKDEEEMYRAVLIYTDRQGKEQRATYGPNDLPGTAQGNATREAKWKVPPGSEYKIEVQAVIPEWETIKVLDRKR